MKVWILVGLMMASFSSFAATLVCGEKSDAPKVTFEVSPYKFSGEFALTAESDYIEADVCEPRVDEVFAPYVSRPENVRGVCVLILGNAGDGLMAILRDLREERGAWFAEIKLAEVENPSDLPGETLLKCKEID